MDYPIIISGRPRGRLSMSRDGLYTVIEAQLPGVHDGLHRLWLHGGGESAYLGLMQPWSGGMYLRRKLSRQQLSCFPKNPEYASDCENVSLHNHKPESKTAPPPPEPLAAPEPTPQLSACPTTPKPDARHQYFRRPDGTLLCFDGCTLRPLPR